MAKYRKKPVEIEAVQWRGENHCEIFEFCGLDNCSFASYLNLKRFYVHTLEGTLRADEGDYIIKGIKGEFYPCKPDIFEMTYESVEDND